MQSCKRLTTWTLARDPGELTEYSKGTLSYKRFFLWLGESLEVPLPFACRLGKMLLSEGYFTHMLPSTRAAMTTTISTSTNGDIGWLSFPEAGHIVFASALLSLRDVHVARLP